MTEPAVTPFVETSVFRVKEGAVLRSERTGWNALVTGASGTGKSWAFN